MTLQSRVFQLDAFDDAFELEEFDFATSFREVRWDHVRVDWDAHITQLLHENRFQVEYRMTLGTFYKLCDYIHHKIKRNFKKSKSTEPIIDEIIVGVGLRFLAGGKLNDIRYIYGISIATAYTCKKSFIDAV